MARAGKNATASPRPPLLLRVGNRFALPPLTRPTNKRSRAGEIFVSIRDKPTAIFSNKRKLPLLGVMTGEPVFKRFRRVFCGQKKCGAYGARTRNLCRDRAAL